MNNESMNIENIEKEIKVYSDKGEVIRSVPVVIPMIRDEYTGELCYTPEAAKIVDGIISNNK